MAAKKASTSRTIPALKVQQWLDTWNEIRWNPKAKQAQPEPTFYLFSLSAPELKALTGVYRRSAKDLKARAEDPNVQRGHESERSKLINRFVQFGYPWCEMSEAKRKSDQYKDLRKPGWLPTAIIVNILAKDDSRGVHPDDLIEVRESRGGSLAELVLPRTFTGPGWRYKKVPPIEVIDGQHRLWAFEDSLPSGTFELPVVAFNGLDRSWQAYLFWSINVTPKRINASLAFDLYPLLRTEDWLERFHGHSIYRETRAQELVEALWSHPGSPWHNRINMLGERALGSPMVSQAAWIRSLMATMMKQWEGRGTRIGGLFGAPMGDDRPVLPWSRAQQAAFLIRAGTSLRDAIKRAKTDWTKPLRSSEQQKLFESADPAFYGKHTLLSTDQGIRGFLFVVNDLCYVRADELQLADWQLDPATATDAREVSDAINSMHSIPLSKFIDGIGDGLASYDWRTSSAPGLSTQQQQMQAAFRGSSGYKLLRTQLLTHLSGSARKDIASAAKTVSTILK